MKTKHSLEKLGGKLNALVHQANNPHPPPAKHSEHTALPWHIGGNVSGRGCAVEITTLSGKRIASVGDHHIRADGLHPMYNAYTDCPGFELPEANARFIVTACNSFEAMREALQNIQRQVDNVAKANYKPDAASLLMVLTTIDIEARTALALAEGRDV